MTPIRSSRTVLVVDDDRDVQRFLTERLEREGWRVICEKDGDWALRSFERRRVDAVVLDILIPVINGFQVAEQIRQIPGGDTVGIIMLTGIYRGAKHRGEAIERYGLIDYLDKPVEAERLVDLLRHHFADLDARGIAPAAPISYPGIPSLPSGTPAPGSAPTGTPAPTAADASVGDLTAPIPAPPIFEPAPPEQIDDQQRREKRQVERATRNVSAAPEDADLRGNLKRITFPRLLARLYRKQATGGLFLLRGKMKKIVYLSNGHPTFIKSNVLDECLGRVLCKEKMITEKECEESVRRMKVDKRQQGSVLIEMGVISPHNLRFGLERQLAVKLYDVFSWLEGEYVFRADVTVPDDVIAMDLSNAQIILEGVRRGYDDKRLGAVLTPVMGQYLHAADDPELRYQDLGLSPGDSMFVGAMDGTSTVEEILVEADDPRNAKALIYALTCAGVLVTKDEPAPRKRAASLPGFDSGAYEAAALPPPPGGPGVYAAGDGSSDARLAGFLSERRGADAFDILGVVPATPPMDVDRAYDALAREFHPDRYRLRPEGTAALSREAFELVTEAYRDLADPRRRRQLAAAREKARPAQQMVSVDIVIDEATDEAADMLDPAARTLAADKLFKQGQDKLRARDHKGAVGAFLRAVELREDVGDYLAYLGWAQFLEGGGEENAAEAADAALPALEHAVEIAPGAEHPHLFLGMVYVAMQRPDLAEPELEAAVQVNPDSNDALRELRNLHQRRQKAGARTGTKRVDR